MAQLDLVIAAGELDNVEQSDFKKPATGGQSPVKKDPVQNLQNAGSSDLIVQSVYANQLVNMGKQTAMSWINYAKTQYADFTGDYIGQKKIDNSFAIAQAAISMGTSIGMGFVAGGVAGGVTAAVVQVGSLATNYIQSEITYNRNIAKKQTQASFNSSNIGAILVNGNRW